MCPPTWNERCDQCLFSANRIVSKQRAANVITECVKEDTYFVCHKPSKSGENVVCKGFYDAYPNTALFKLQRFFNIPMRIINL